MVDAYDKIYYNLQVTISMRKSTAAKGKPFNAKDYERPGISISEIE